MNGTLLVRIWDPNLDGNGLPNDSVGKVTITGTYSSGQLRILAAGTGDAWSDDPDQILNNAGLLHLGLDIADGVVVTDSALRARTRLSAYTVGDIRGEIELGQVQRVQCGVPGSAPTGTISANITTLASTNAFSAGENPVASIIAGDAIAGTIRATQGNIGLVQVGPHEDASGISGDILAEAGSIRSIFTTGPIDSGTSTRLRITAGTDIGEIRTIVESSGTLLARDVDADITSNKVMLDDPEAFTYQGPTYDGPLAGIDIGGDLRGEVHVGSLSSGAGASGRVGIFVRGICYAPITVDYSVELSNIVAQTFTSPITIGRTLRGAVVATGGATEPNDPPPGYADGAIPSISVGSLLDGDLPNQTAESNYLVLGRGIAGMSAVPSTIPVGDEWFTATPLGGFNGGALDDCIRAQRVIGEATVAAMTNAYYHGAGQDASCLKFPPVIESPVIGTLALQDLAAGTVWSGQYDENDPDSVYAAIVDIQIGCVRRYGAIRAKGWSSFTVQQHMFGDIHVPEVAAMQRIVIGGILGDDTNAVYDGDLQDEICRCNPNPVAVCEDCVNDLSSDYYAIYGNLGGFRNPCNPYLHGCAQDQTGDDDRRGQVWIHHTDALAGQIIINGNANDSQTIPTSALFTGAVQLGETASNCPESEISPAQSPPWESPYYVQHASALGGGAVGLVPFHLHVSDCDPPDDSDAFSNAAFCGLPYGSRYCEADAEPVPYDPVEITLPMYGYVRAENGNYRPYHIWILDGSGDERYDVDYAQWTAYSLVPEYQNGPARRLVMNGGEFTQLPAGRYHIRPNLTTSQRLLCDGLLPGAPTTPAADFTYTFTLFADCNTDGVDDATETFSDTLCCFNFPCDPDYNRDGNADNDDVSYLVAAIASGYSPSGRDPDFNGDGNTDQDDVQALVNAVGGGGCP